jgi:hypothetical protein
MSNARELPFNGEGMNGDSLICGSELWKENSIPFFMMDSFWTEQKHAVVSLCNNEFK